MKKLFRIWERSNTGDEIDVRAMERDFEIARIKTEIAALRRKLKASDYVHQEQTEQKITQKEKEVSPDDTSRQKRDSELNDLKAKLLGKRK